MSRFLIGRLETKKSVRWLNHVVQCVAGHVVRAKTFSARSPRIRHRRKLTEKARANAVPTSFLALRKQERTLRTRLTPYGDLESRLPMIYLRTDTRMMSPETYFLCFVQHGAVFKMFAEDYFGLSK